MLCCGQASIVLIDWWKETDGVQQYLGWCAGNTTEKTAFFSNSACNTLYFNHVTAVLNRWVLSCRIPPPVCNALVLP